MIHGVFFDLDGTLYDRDEHILRMTREQFEVFAPELEGIDSARFAARTLELDGHGHNRTPDFYPALMREWGLPQELGQRLETHFRANFHRQLLLSDDTLETLMALRKRGKKLGIITNGPVNWQSRKVDSLGVRVFFDTVVISDAEGIKKPDPEIFVRALSRCGIAPADAMFVGDHPEADIQGARSAGLLPIWKRMPYWEAPGDVQGIDKLSEILPLCL